jgi:hypothetical protein
MISESDLSNFLKRFPSDKILVVYYPQDKSLRRFINSKNEPIPTIKEVIENLNNDEKKDRFDKHFEQLLFESKSTGYTVRITELNDDVFIERKYCVILKARRLWE